MTLKYNYTFDTSQNFVVDALIFVNQNSYSLFNYLFIIAFFIVLFYVFNLVNNDKELSFNLSLFSTIILSTLFYYFGVYLENTYSLTNMMFSGFVLITMVVLFVISFSIMRFNRNTLNE